MTAKLTGRKRGRDRAVRRESYDIDDPKAQPWKPIGTVGEGLAHREALLQVANEQRLQHWRDFPAKMIREARDRRAQISIELAAVAGECAGPPGHTAKLRIELSSVDQLLAAARAAIRLIDIEILRALIERIDFATGKLFPAIDTIAADAGCHRNSVVGALKRLRLHGFIAWVRRSMSTGNEGQLGPQREQTSNAYYFDHRARMASRTWQRFTQILVAKLRRLGKVPPASTNAPPARPVAEDPLGLHSALAAFSADLANAST